MTTKKRDRDKPGPNDRPPRPGQCACGKTSDRCTCRNVPRYTETINWG